MTDIGLDDQEFTEAVARGEAERASQPMPSAVRYDAPSSRIVVEFRNGTTFMVPTAVLQGLADAAPDDLAQVELAGETGLHWPTLDVDFTIAGLMQGMFGTARFMEASKRGGQSRSPAKIAAARENGKRGGRPRKTS